MERCTSGVGEREGRREDDRDAQETAPLSPVALMWAEDKVRLVTGMPGAQWDKKEQSMRWKDENRRKE